MNRATLTDLISEKRKQLEYAETIHRWCVNHWVNKDDPISISAKNMQLPQQKAEINRLRQELEDLLNIHRLQCHMDSPDIHCRILMSE